MTQQIVGLLGRKGAGKDTAAQAFLRNGWQRIAFGDALYLEISSAFGVSLDFLKDRDVKETPRLALALQCCSESLRCCSNFDFVRTILTHIDGLDGFALPQNLTKRQWDEEFANNLSPALRLAYTRPRSPREILQLWGTEYRRKFGPQADDAYWLNQVMHTIAAKPDTNFVITDVRFPNETAAIEAVGGSTIRIVRPDLPLASETHTLTHISETALNDFNPTFELINEEGSSEKLLQDIEDLYLLDAAMMRQRESSANAAAMRMHQGA